MKLILARVMPLALALLVPSLAFAETPSAGKGHATHVAKRAKSGAKAGAKARVKPAKPKAAPKPHKPAKAPKASKKAKQ